MRLLPFLLMMSACHQDPPWARADHPVAGDPTVTGAPAEVPRLPAPPTLDGKLDDAAWSDAATIGPLVEIGSGRDPGSHPVAGFARLGWDDRALYLGIVVRDGKPTSPFQRGDDDPHVWGSSSGVELMLQPGDPGDNRDYYELQVDVNGAVFDSHFDDYNQPITVGAAGKIFGHQDWSAKAERAIYVQKGHFWSAEIVLPWSSLAAARVPLPPREGDVWRLNLYTFRDGQRLALGWAPIRGQGNFHRASRFGRVRFSRMFKVK
jgi:Carbohydrate family 9 binding domain-like